MQIEIQRIDLQELINSVVSDFEGKLINKKIKVINEVKKTYVENNYDMLKHIVANIFENAIKY